MFKLFYLFISIVLFSSLYEGHCSEYEDYLLLSIAGKPLMNRDVVDKIRLNSVVTTGKDEYIELESYVREDVIDSLIDEMLLDYYADISDIDITDVDLELYIDGYLNSIISKGIFNVLNIDPSVESLKRFLTDNHLYAPLKREVKARMVIERFVKNYIVDEIKISAIELQNVLEYLSSGKVSVINVKYMTVDSNVCSSKDMLRGDFYDLFEDKISRNENIWLSYDGDMLNSIDRGRIDVFKVNTGSVLLRSLGDGGCIALEILDRLKVSRSVLEGDVLIKKLKMPEAMDVDSINISNKDPCKSLFKFAKNNDLDNPEEINIRVKDLSSDIQNIIFKSKSNHIVRDQDIFAICKIIPKEWNVYNVKDMISSYKISYKVSQLINGLRRKYLYK